MADVLPLDADMRPDLGQSCRWPDELWGAAMRWSPAAQVWSIFRSATRQEKKPRGRIHDPLPQRIVHNAPFIDRILGQGRKLGNPRRKAKRSSYSVPFQYQIRPHIQFRLSDAGQLASRIICNGTGSTSDQ